MNVVTFGFPKILSGKFYLYPFSKGTSCLAIRSWYSTPNICMLTCLLHASSHNEINVLTSFSDFVRCHINHRFLQEFLIALALPSIYVIKLLLQPTNFSRHCCILPIYQHKQHQRVKFHCCHTL